MKSMIGLGTLGILCAIATSSGVASAAAGESIVTGSAGGTFTKSVGNFKAGAVYTDVTTSSYSQWPDLDEAQIISLSATSMRNLYGLLHDKQIHVLGLLASSHGSRQGSHMTGSARGRIQVNGSVMWEDGQDYDVTAWAGSEAEVSKAQQIYSHSKSYTALIPVGPASINLKGTIGGSVSITSTASSDFSTGGGRQGRIVAVTSGTARADLHGAASFGIPYAANIGLYADINVLTVSMPAVGLATWSWSRDRPNDSANQYSCVSVNNIAGETGGGTFGAKLLGPANIVIAKKELASWGGRQVFEGAFVNESQSDVGKFE